MLDRALLLALAAAALQVVPLPQAAVAALSPHARRVAAAFSLAPLPAWMPVSITPRDTAVALAVALGAAALFVSVRAAAARGGVRTLVRGVALAGLALAAIGIAQDATGGGQMYWRWRPVDDGPAPFGPFVNRNHFATWAILAASLTAGHLAAHAAAHRASRAHASWRRALAAALDGRAALLLAALLMLALAVAVSLSRSGLLGLGAAAVTAFVLQRRRRRHDAAAASTAWGWTAGIALLILALAVLTRVGPTALAGRVAAADVAVADRVTIWRDTVPIVRDFRVTGAGLGTFERVMAVYQRSHPGVLFNQAHNHYLHLAAEGGLLVTIPVLFVLVSFVRAAAAGLDRDRSPILWLRIGALSGLAGVAVQSVWETGLTTPANAALAAIAAAVATHEPSPGPGGR